MTRGRVHWEGFRPRVAMVDVRVAEAIWQQAPDATPRAGPAVCAAHTLHARYAVDTAEDLAQWYSDPQWRPDVARATVSARIERSRRAGLRARSAGQCQPATSRVAAPGAMGEADPR